MEYFSRNKIATADHMNTFQLIWTKNESGGESVPVMLADDVSWTILILWISRGQIQISDNPLPDVMKSISTHGSLFWKKQSSKQKILVCPPVQKAVFLNNRGSRILTSKLRFS